MAFARRNSSRCNLGRNTRPADVGKEELLSNLGPVAVVSSAPCPKIILAPVLRRRSGFRMTVIVSDSDEEGGDVSREYAEEDWNIYSLICGDGAAVGNGNVPERGAFLRLAYPTAGFLPSIGF